MVRVITTTTFGGPPVAFESPVIKRRKGSRGARPTPQELQRFGEESRQRQARQQSEVRRGQVRKRSVVFKAAKIDLPDVSKVTLDPVAFSLGITATSSAAIAKKLRDVVKQTGKSAGQVSKEREDILKQVSALKKTEQEGVKLQLQAKNLKSEETKLKDTQRVLSSKDFLTDQDVALFDTQVKNFNQAKAVHERQLVSFKKESETLQKLARLGLAAAQPGRVVKAEKERQRLIKQAEDLGIEFKELERRGVKIEGLRGAEFKKAIVKAIEEEKAKQIAPLEKVKVDKFDLGEQIKDISGIPKALVETVVSTPKRVKGVFEAKIKPEFKGKPLEEFIGGAAKFPVAGLEATVGTFALGAEKFFERAFPRGVAIRVSTGKLKALKEAREVLPDIPVVGKFFEEPIKGIITKKGEIEISRKTAPTVGFVAPFFVGIPGLKTIPKGFKAVTKVVSKTKTGLGSIAAKVAAKLPPKKLTRLEIRKIVQEAARKPPEFPLGVKPTKFQLPTLPIATQKAFKITKKFIETEAKIKAGIPEGQFIRSFKLKEVVPNIEKTKFVDDLAKEFGVSKQKIVDILKEERIVSSEKLKDVFGFEGVQPKVVKGQVTVIDITTREIPGTIKHELTHAVQRKLGFKGTEAQIEAQARKAERFGGVGIVEGPGFPLTFKPKPPSGEGLTFFKTTKVKPVTLDTTGLTKVKVDKAAARLKEVTLKEKEPFVAKKPTPTVFREKPLPLKDFSSQQQKPTTITTQKQKVKKFKPKVKVKPIAFEPSTQEFVPSTQKFKKRFFEETEARPLQEFVPKEARVPKTVKVPIGGIKTTFLEDVRFVEGLVPSIGTIGIQKEFEKVKTDFAKGTALKQITSIKSRVGELVKTASKQAEQLKPASRKAEQLKLKSPQRILPRTTIKVLTRTVTKPIKVTRPTKPRQIIKPKIPPIILLGDKDAFGKEKKLVTGYDSFVKEDATKQARWVKATKQPRPEAVAREKGLKAVDNTISQQTEIRKSRKKVQRERTPLRSLIGKFRQVKVSGTKKRFIEQRGFAIDSLGEKQKLKASAFIARERKRTLGLPLRKTKGFKKSKSLKERKRKRRFL